MERRAVVIISFALLLSVCVGANATQPGDEERGRLSTKMVNLSSAVDTYFSFLSRAPAGDDATVLKSATSHDSRLMPIEFEAYLLRVQYQNPYAVILLCSKDGRQSIIEDAGCSARIDRQVKDTLPCEFTLQVLPGCKVEGADPVRDK